MLIPEVCALVSICCSWSGLYEELEHRISFGLCHTLDNRFQVNRQSIGSYSNKRAIVARDMYRLALLDAYCGRQ